MKRDDYALIIGVAVISAIISLIISSVLFSTPSKRSTKVPTIQVVQPSFPDVRNEPAYQAFLNTNALDPTQPIHIGNSPNPSPFQ